jgi:hypothetical protein
MSERSSFTHECDGERLSGVYGDGGGAGAATAVLLHGAGHGSKERLLPLLAEFGAHGCPALAFDFSGHGESSGALGESSLRRRFEQAVADLERRLDLLAAQLVRIHEVVPDERPRPYQAWTSPMGSPTRAKPRVGEGPHAGRAAVGAGGGRDPPRTPVLRGLFPAPGLPPRERAVRRRRRRAPGVVDWVETSWGPADLVVAHCSTALALLHGPEYGLGFRDRYEAHGGRRLADGPDHLYWRLLDALGYSPDAAKLAGPWRELGRTDLTAEVLGGRLEAYVAGLMEAYA